MKLLVGLGNPGEKYKNNRHNVGFLVVDALKNRVSSFQSPVSSKIKIFKSQNFMNSSGEFVNKLVVRYQINPSDLWVIHDDLDIPLGSYKIQKGKGPKLHYGVNSIEEKLGTADFWRVRIGVENRPERTGEPSFAKASAGKDYVLEDFSNKEMELLRPVVKEICKKLATS